MYFLVKRQFHAHCLATSFLYQGPAPPHSERMTFLPALLRKGFPGGHSGKDLPASAGRCKRHGFNPWVGKIPWRRAWQPTPVFLPGESHGQRSLAGYMGSHSQTRLKRLSSSKLLYITNHGVPDGHLVCQPHHQTSPSKLSAVFRSPRIFCLLEPHWEKALATHSSILAWKTPWTEKPGGLQSMGSLRV